MREVKVVTSENETAFEEKFSEAVEEVEGKGKIIDIRFRTNAVPARPNASASSRLYYTAFITYEPSSGKPEMESIQ
jgi:hypothetical protein